MGSLMESLKKQRKFSEAEVRVIMEQALLALDFFERKKIVHRDIKPDNILIYSVQNRLSQLGLTQNVDENSDFEVRIADLGLSVQTPEDELLYNKCGTPGYVAPEVFSDSGYSYKADIFSLGSVFFNLLTGYFMFSGSHQDEVLRQNKSCKISHWVKEYIKFASPQCQDLFMMMISLDPQKRPSAQ